MAVRIFFFVFLGSCVFHATGQAAAGDIYMTPVAGAPYYIDLNYQVDVWLDTGGADPDTIQFDLTFDNSTLYLPFSTSSNDFPPVFSNSKIVLGPQNTELKLQVSHSDSEPGILRVVRAGGDPADITSPAKLFTVTFTPLIGGSHSVMGDVEVLRDDALATIGTPQVVTSNFNAQGRFNVHLDFDHPGSQVGTLSNPYVSVTQAVNGTASGAVVNIYPGSSSEIITISKFLTLSAVDGLVRIGVSPSKIAPITNDSPALLLLEHGDSSENLLLSLLEGMRWSAGSSSDDEESELASGALFEKALPQRREAVAGITDSFAVRLRSESPIDLGGVWGFAQGPGITSHEFELIQLAENDLWVIFPAPDGLQPGDVVSLAAGATGIEDVTHDFTLGADMDAAEVISQPDYTHFDASVLDLSAESNDENRLMDAEVPALPDGVGVPLRVAPSRVFNTPQRVWVPLPAGVKAGEVSLHYYLEENGAGAWHPAEDIAGWLVPGSLLQLDLSGQQYLGFTVQHGGILQLK